MKIALFSDIHSNLPAPESLFISIENNKPDAIYCLGDLVGYNIWPNEVINEIRNRNIPAIAGNYDFGIGRASDDKYVFITHGHIDHFYYLPYCNVSSCLMCPLTHLPSDYSLRHRARQSCEGIAVDPLFESGHFVPWTADDQVDRFMTLPTIIFKPLLSAQSASCGTPSKIMVPIFLTEFA